MGVYIKDLKKPKDCYECPIAKSYLDCLMEKKYVCTIGHTDDCPLTEIDLVKCGECKHMRKYALRSDEPTGIWCHRWSVPRLVTDDDFCSYGERRADDNTIKANK